MGLKDEKQKEIEKVKHDADVKFRDMMEHDETISSTISCLRAVQSSLEYMVGRVGDVDFLPRK